MKAGLGMNSVGQQRNQRARWRPTPCQVICHDSRLAVSSSQVGNTVSPGETDLKGSDVLGTPVRAAILCLIAVAAVSDRRIGFYSSHSDRACAADTNKADTRRKTFCRPRALSNQTPQRLSLMKKTIHSGLLDSWFAGASRRVVGRCDEATGEIIIGLQRDRTGAKLEVVGTS